MALPQTLTKFKQCGHIRQVDTVSVELANNIRGGLICIPCNDALMDSIDKTGGIITQAAHDEFMRINSFENWEIVNATS